MMEELHGEWLGYEIWFNGFNYFIKDGYGKKSRDYDKVWYCRRAIELNNIEWLKDN